MINLILAAARLAIEMNLPTEVIAVRAGMRLVRRASITGRVPKRRIVRKRGRMGVLDAALANVRRGVAAVPRAEGTEVTPTRILPPLSQEGEGTAFAPGVERIPVPPNAFPFTPTPGNYFQSNKFTQNIYNSQAQTSPGPLPPPQKEVNPDPKLNNLIKYDILSNLLSGARGLAENWLPRIEWEGVVSATGFPTTPTRTVVHYALAVAFGLIKQQRVSGCTLAVNVDYETNHVSVAYISKAYWLTELMTLGIYSLAGSFPPGTVPDISQIGKKNTDSNSRSLTSGFLEGAFAGGMLLGKQGVQLAGDALKTILKAYQNMGRLLGPLAVYDLGDDTLYGGRASALLRAPFQPEPFNSMQTDKNGKPVPLLTRLPAPNPQPAVAIGTDPSAGYSLDLRSLVVQALYDPGIVPPVPDTNVTLPTAI